MSKQYFAVNLILGCIFEEKTQKQKTRIVTDKIWSIRKEKNVFIQNQTPYKTKQKQNK